MRCSGCQTDNLPDALFCAECGTPLRAGCPACGTANDLGANYCRRCGRAIASARGDVQGSPRNVPGQEPYTPPHLVEEVLSSPSALEGERKHVTVLFADVKDSVELAGQVGPETWHRIMDRFFALLAAGVHRLEGTVNQYTGDGIMALFGAPIAHEDHAQRACLCALQLRDDLRRLTETLRREHGLEFAVRMGLNSGEVVVGAIGPGLRMDYTAQGHTVGLAARMEHMALAGTAYLTEQTARLVSGFFEMEDLGAFAVQGVTEPVRTFALRGLGPVRTRLQLSRTRGFSAFVGRAEEMAALDAALERARAGDGAVIAVIGDAGVGKSRLCLEFVDRCRTEGITVYEAHCPAHGSAIPFTVVRELLREALGLRESTAEDEVRRRIAGALALRVPAGRDALPYLFDILGIPDPDRPPSVLEPEARQEAVIELACRLVRAHSEDDPVVVLVDDLHGSDAESRQFVDRFAEAVAGTPTLLIVNFRPEYRLSWAASGAAPGYREVVLTPPDAASVRELLRGLLGEHSSLGELPRLVHERTGGNPFFIEEVVRSLVEEGVLVPATDQPVVAGDPATGLLGPPYRLMTPVTDVGVPPTVQSVIAARVDRLADREKRSLQVAAVVGKTFSPAVLEVVLRLPAEEISAALAVLRRAAMIDGDSLASERPHVFCHPLVQEVVYHALLAEPRARLHASVARALEELHADALGQHAAQIAHHYEAANYRGSAARWWRRATLHVTRIQVPQRRRRPRGEAS